MVGEDHVVRYDHRFLFQSEEITTTRKRIKALLVVAGDAGQSAVVVVVDAAVVDSSSFPVDVSDASSPRAETLLGCLFDQLMCCELFSHRDHVAFVTLLLPLPLV